MSLRRIRLGFTVKLAVAATLIFGLTTVGYTFGVADEATRIWASDILNPVLGFAVVLLFGYAAWRSGRYSRALGIAWWALTAAQVCWFLGDLFWGILEVGLHIEPYPSIADAFYILYYAVFLVGVILLPSERQSVVDRIRRLLDAGVVMLAATVVFWLFWLGPLLSTVDTTDPWTLFFSLAYPISDLVLIWSTLTLLLRRLRAQPSLPLVLLGISAMVGTASDVIYTAKTLDGTYASGTWLDLGWVAVLLISLWAAAHQANADPEKLKLDEAPTVAADHGRLAWLRLSLPYLSLIGAFVLLALVQNNAAGVQSVVESRDLELAIVALVFLIGARQVLTLVDNARLSTRLQVQLGQQQAVESALRLEIAERKRIEDALRESQERLSHDAVHDTLTGLPNRALFIDRLERSVERGKRNPGHRFAVYLLDFDGFKSVNDRLGHPLGDALLIHAAARLKQCLRSSDTVARLGSDEFVVLLEDVEDVQAATTAAERLQAALSEGFDLTGNKVALSASIGIVVSGAGLHLAEDILRNADIAMGQAKLAGKARHAVFDASMGARALARLDLESEMRGAIERQEFRLQYQPIVDARTRRLVGLEALLRWRHPRLGNISPGDFIPIAEDTGLIVPIGTVVLREACRQMVEWQLGLNDIGAQSTININLSARQFRQPDLVAQVTRVLQESGLPPQCLNLEVTESVIIGDAAAAVSTMRSLHALGVKLHIDDFGTGYSSLSYLYQFPIDTLKIDRAFVAGLSRDGRNRRIVDNIVALAHDLGLTVIAEGVETADQATLIESIGCEQMQGFYFSKPLDATAVPDAVARLRASAVKTGMLSP